MNFVKLFNLFTLFVQYKQDSLKEIVKSYQKHRMPHYEATYSYLSVLRKNGPSNLKQISKKINKPYNTIIGVYNRLERQCFVSKYGRKFTGSGSTPSTYEITKKGVKYLNYE